MTKQATQAEAMIASTQSFMLLTGQHTRCHLVNVWRYIATH
jgi:hypothetical protein